MNADILSVVSSLGHRSETWLYRQLMLARRHRVHVYTERHVNSQEYPYADLTLAGGPWRFRGAGRIRRALGLPSDWIARSARQLRRLIETPEIRMVQAHFGWTGYELHQAFGELEKPVVVWLYGSDVFRSGPCRDEWLPRLFETRAVFACTSEALRREIVTLGCARERTRVVYPHHPAGGAPARAVRPAGALRIVSVGRLVDVKDPIGLVDVAERLLADGLRFEWRVVGDGMLRAQMLQRLARSPAATSLHLVGEQPHTVVLQEMARADLVIHNGRIAPDGGREAFGVVLLEAGALGIPVVAADVGGIPEIVVHDRTGLLSRPGHPDEMAAAVLRLARSPRLRERLGACARAHVAATFAPDGIADQLDCFYDDVITGDLTGREPPAARAPPLSADRARDVRARSGAN